MFRNYNHPLSKFQAGEKSKHSGRPPRLQGAGKNEGLHSINRVMIFTSTRFFRRPSNFVVK